MKPVPQIKTVMTPFPYSIEIGARLISARDMMVEHDIHHLPVMDDGGPVGVLTQRDIHLALDPALGLPPEHELVVRDVCDTDPYVVDLGEPLDRVLETMASRHIGSVLVVKDGRLAGIFTSTDACRCFGEFLRGLLPKGSGDDAA